MCAVLSCYSHLQNKVGLCCPNHRLPGSTGTSVNSRTLQKHHKSMRDESLSAATPPYFDYKKKQCMTFTRNTFAVFSSAKQLPFSMALFSYPVSIYARRWIWHPKIHHQTHTQTHHLYIDTALTSHHSREKHSHHIFRRITAKRIQERK